MSQRKPAAIGLAMLVRDEADTVERAIVDATRVCDHVTVVDTGSEDGTRDIVRDLLTSIPGTLHEREWKGFGPNRTELLNLAQGTADYHLCLDADHTLHINGNRPKLRADSYQLRIHGNEEWWLPLLLKDGHPFEWKGAAHSYLRSPSATREERLDWLSIDGGGGVTTEKLERDKTLLEQAFLDDPADARTVHYLAQTYRDLGETDRAIVFYRIRANMAGFDEETYWARQQLGCLLSEHVSFAQGADELLRAFRERPTRMESLRALANAANAVADKTPQPDDRLFVRPAAYRKETA